MIYIINNCERYPEDRYFFFVDAPESFSQWFKTILVPWQISLIHAMNGRAWFQVHEIVCVATTATFPGKIRPISVDMYLAKNSFTTRLVRDDAPRYTPTESSAVIENP